MNEKIQKEFKRLSNLKQNKTKNSEADKQELWRQAQINIAKKSIKVDDAYLNPQEKAQALELFEHYVGTYEFEKFTDLCTLSSLIYEEILLRRIQSHINTLYQKNKDTYIDKRDRDALTETEKRVEELKIKLGIDREDTQEDDLTALQLLQKRFEKYINANKNEFTTVCGSCGKLLLLRKKVKDFDCLEHPWFAGRWFFNYEILRDVKEKRISKEQAWRYLCSASKGETENIAFAKEYCIDYINYCLENWDNIVENLNKRG